jgi:predicted 3-demethylubiquinone-9 3-methyltransferase (glyoxalase superfamily)
MQVATSLWFDDQALEAAELYTSLIPGSRIVNVARYGPGAPLPEGTVMTVDFELAGQRYNALNGGPAFSFTEATSVLVMVDGQDEVDRLWDALTAEGGEESMCGWLKDRFGLSWQVVPTALPELLGSSDPDTSRRVMEAMLKMRKIDVAELERAAAAA